MTRRHIFSFSILLVSFFSCETSQDDKNEFLANGPLLELMKSSDTGINFRNTSIESPKRHLGFYDYFYNGSGVAIGDINNDGLEDIFFAGNDAPNRLFLNEGNFNFRNISNTARIESNQWATGVTMVDINADGYLDIYVCSSGPYTTDNKLANKLYVNNGDLTFTEQAAAYGIDDTSYSSQAVFFDIDADNDLDLFVLNHSLFNYGKSMGLWEDALKNMTREKFRKSCSTLYLNQDNKFTDITEASGLLRAGYGLGVAITDFNDDGTPDIYVTNDYYVPDFLYLNDGKGKFYERANNNFPHTSFYGMGCDAADFNNDGLVDLVVADMTPADHFRSKTLMSSMNISFFNYLKVERKYVPQFMFNSLSLNRGSVGFSEIAHMSGVAKTDWSWATLFCDLDNDTNKDLIITNGFKRDTKDQDWKLRIRTRFQKGDKSAKSYFEELQNAKSIPLSNYLYKNEGDLKFKDVSKEWGFSAPSFSNGAAYGDLDNDGDLDIVVNNLEKEAFVYKNTASERTKASYLQVVLEDQGNSANVLQSKVKVYSSNTMQLQEYSFVRGYLSTMQQMVHFGLGDAVKVDSLEVIWPDGKMSTVKNPPINTKLNIDRSKTDAITKTNTTVKPLFKSVETAASKIDFVHKENGFNDFDKEVLLPHRQSTLGPAMAVGDVNDDGMDDFYVGGAMGQSGALYLQTTSSFQRVNVPFNKDKSFEDLGAHFFDMDGDGDLDLYVASGGGGDVASNVRLLQDRLYENDGSGIFKTVTKRLPLIDESTKTIVSLDVDSDGDLDLFVGGRNVPGEYPTTPKSYLLLNTEGSFTDATETIAPGLRNLGMVTSAIVADINGDDIEDLMVVGEWMEVKAFVSGINGLVDTSDSLGLAGTEGWWFGINAADFDADGDVDFVVGNLGLNNKFNPTENKPLHIFSHDFDNNGTLDIVLSKDYKGSLAPVRGKECSTEQMPFLEEKFPMYSDFASSSLKDIYGEENLQKALHFQVASFESIYLENTGKGKLIIHPLPKQAQLSPIHSFVIQDYDNDGILDVVAAGNIFNTEPETPAYDAGKGLFLKGLGDGTFSAILNPKISGVKIPLNCKDMHSIRLGSKKQPAILVANNNYKIQLLSTNN